MVISLIILEDMSQIIHICSDLKKGLCVGAVAPVIDGDAYMFQ